MPGKIIHGLTISLFIIILAFTSPAFGTWSSGDTHFWNAIGLTGGDAALDGISGVSIGPDDVAYTIDTSGLTFYVHVVKIGGATTESSPNLITPDSLQAGGIGGGTTMWELASSRVSGFYADRIYVQGTRWDDGSGGIKASQLTGDASPAGTWDFSTGTSTSAKTPTDNSHIATKKYVDDNIGAGGVGGSGVTTIQTDDGSEAEAATIGDAPSGIFLKGESGISTTASGNTVYVGPNETELEALIDVNDLNDISSVSGWIVDAKKQVHSQVTDFVTGNYTNSSGLSNYVQSQVTEYPYNSSVTSWLTDRTNAAAFTGATGFITGTTDIQFADLTTYTAINAVSGNSINYSSGVSIASAVTEVGVFSISNPQDYGGGSASSPFLVGHFPAEVYPNGVYVHSLKVRNTGLSSQSSTVVFSEWSSGSSSSVIGTLTTSANTWVKDSALLDVVIDGGNDLFAEALSGISELAGTYIFFPR